jgi:hypothetical protein
MSEPLRHPSTNRGPGISWPDPETGPWLVSVRFERRDHHERPFAVTVEWHPGGLLHEPGDELPDESFVSILRRLPIGRLIKESREGLDAVHVFDRAAVEVANELQQRMELAESDRAAREHDRQERLERRRAGIYSKAPTGRGRPPVSDEHLERVAGFYRELCTLDHPAPRQAVADEWGVKPSTASRWIALARRRGYLGAAPEPGRSGERSTS